MNATPDHFKISSALKNLIGKDLITDDFVAIFELVKNAFDAYASNVSILFLANRIVIADNGKGMSAQDIKDKWLFVAYSAKQDGSEDAKLGDDFRERIGKRSGRFAGNKGVGRFSCDRLGSQLHLQTREQGGCGPIHNLVINWDRFEIDSKDEFVNIDVSRSERQQYDVPKELDYDSEHGSVLVIDGLRSSWPREKILKLKASLAKLINPFGNVDDKVVTIVAPAEDEADKQILAQTALVDEIGKELSSDSSGIQPEIPIHYYDLVNGPVHNFILDQLLERTTRIDVQLNSKSNTIDTTLVDRGDMIYHVKEENPDKHLHGCDISIQLNYLNRSAKRSFSLLMKVKPNDFGHVFLFNKGFRIYPNGEPNNDWLMLDKRKTQGTSRFLGTRDVLGKVEVEGSIEKFRESTSRDGGLIDTPSTLALRSLFLEKALKRLEAYLGSVNWADKAEQERHTTVGLRSDAAKARIIGAVSKLTASKDIELIDYNKDFIHLINEKSNEFENSLKSLANISEKIGDAGLLDEVKQATKRLEALKKAEKEALELAEAERKAREEAEQEAGELKEELEEEKKKNLFLARVTNRSTDDLLNLHHQIVHYTAGVQERVSEQMEMLRDKEEITEADWLSFLEHTSFQNKRIMAISKFATSANFRLDSGKITEDLVQFIVEYVKNISWLYAKGVNVKVEECDFQFETTFSPMEIAIIVDNFVNNAGKNKANADNLIISFEKLKENEIQINFTDDGDGLDKTIKDTDRIFEMGVTTTSGSGLGLYHVKVIMDNLKGGVSVNADLEKGVEFQIRVKKSAT